ncbi:MAG: hypothetical protein ACPG8R_06440 [Flavobacteriales bacterium]
MKSTFVTHATTHPIAMNIPAQYDPTTKEDKWYAHWLEACDEPT